MASKAQEHQSERVGPSDTLESKWPAVERMAPHKVSIPMRVYKSANRTTGTESTGVRQATVSASYTDRISAQH